MARRRKEIEEPEIDADLIPIMNIMFLLIPALLLAMEVARFAAINVSPPKYAVSAEKKEQEDKKKPLNLKIFVMVDGYRVSASGQQQGADAGKAEDSSQPTIPLAKPGAPLDDYARYDYVRLEAEAKKFKQLFPHETVVTISAENTIPLQAMANTMDALRGITCKAADLDRILAGEDVSDKCLFWQPILDAGAG